MYYKISNRDGLGLTTKREVVIVKKRMYWAATLTSSVAVAVFVLVVWVLVQVWLFRVHGFSEPIDIGFGIPY